MKNIFRTMLTPLQHLIEKLYKTQDEMIDEIKAVNSELNDKAKKTEIPVYLSELEEDQYHRTVSDYAIELWNEKSNFDGKFTSLSGVPELPQMKRAWVGKNVATYKQGVESSGSSYKTGDKEYPYVGQTTYKPSLKDKIKVYVGAPTTRNGTEFINTTEAEVTMVRCVTFTNSNGIFHVYVSDDHQAEYDGTVYTWGIAINDLDQHVGLWTSVKFPITYENGAKEDNALVVYRIEAEDYMCVDTSNMHKGIPVIQNAIPGNVIAVKSVDDKGVPTEWEAVDSIALDSIVLADETTGTKYKLTITDGKLTMTEVVE